MNNVAKTYSIKDRGLTLLTVLLVFFWIQAADGNDGPTDQLRYTVNKMIAIVANEAFTGEAKKKERRTKIMTIARDQFEFTEMSKRALGKTWIDRNGKEQSHFVDLFTKLLEHVYIGQLEDYSGQTVNYNKEIIKGERAMVSTTIVDNGEEIPFIYLMLNRNNRWMVYDIIIENVSLVRNYRQQFKTILLKESYEELVKQLEEKIIKLDARQG